MDEKTWCISTSNSPVDGSKESISKAFGGTEEIEKYIKKKKTSTRFLQPDLPDLREEHCNLETEKDSV